MLYENDYSGVKLTTDKEFIDFVGIGGRFYVENGGWSGFLSQEEDGKIYMNTGTPENPGRKCRQMYPEDTRENIMYISRIPKPKNESQLYRKINLEIKRVLQTAITTGAKTMVVSFTTEELEKLEHITHRY